MKTQLLLEVPHQGMDRGESEKKIATWSAKLHKITTLVYFLWMFLVLYSYILYVYTHQWQIIVLIGCISTDTLEVCLHFPPFWIGPYSTFCTPLGTFGAQQTGTWMGRLLVGDLFFDLHQLRVRDKPLGSSPKISEGRMVTRAWFWSKNNGGFHRNSYRDSWDLILLSTHIYIYTIWFDR